MQAKKILGWAVAVFFLFYLLTKPTDVGAFLNHVLSVLRDAGASIASFLNSLN